MLRFKRLWEAHPTIQGESAPCSTNGRKNFPDQCAIRMGSCLAECGIQTTRLVPARRHCWFHEKSEGHVLAAEELAEGLKKVAISGIRPRIEVDPAEYESELSGRRGIIFFKDFWQRSGETFRNRTGDHIDLWSGSRLTDWRTWFMISSTLGAGGTWGSSKEVWFWEMM